MMTSININAKTGIKKRFDFCIAEFKRIRRQLGELSPLYDMVVESICF